MSKILVAHLTNSARSKKGPSMPHLTPMTCDSAGKREGRLSRILLCILIPVLAVLAHYFLKAQNEVYALRKKQQKLERQLVVAQRLAHKAHVMERKMALLTAHQKVLQIKLAEATEQRKNLEETLQELLEAQAHPSHPPAPIEWGHDFKQAYQKARVMDRPLMILFATAHCQWCRKLRQETFRVTAVKLKARQFVCLQLDPKSALQLAKRFKINGVPTFIFLSKQGRELHRVCGYLAPQQLIAEMATALSRLRRTVISVPPPVPGFIRYQKFPHWCCFRFTGILAQSRANDITADGRILWIATDKGVLCYDRAHGKWRLYGRTQGLKGILTTKIISTPRYIFVSSSGPAHSCGIYRFDKQKGRRWERFRLYTASCFAVNGDYLWIGRIFERGVEVYNLRTGRSHAYTTANGLLHNAIGGIAHSPDYVWVTHMGTYNRHTRRFRGGGVSRLDKRTHHWRHFTTRDGLGDSYVRTVCLHGEEVWFGHVEKGLSCYNTRTGHWQVYRHHGPTSIPGAYCIGVSHNSIWFGSLNGLIRRNHKTGEIQMFYERDGLPGNMINGITVSNGSVWIAASSNSMKAPYGGIAQFIESEDPE